MNELPLSNCSACGDRVPGGQHECWAAVKAGEFPVVLCVVCGYQMRQGVCIRWNCS